ncbi:hypothetical protein AB0M48_11080 [Lentzea sp. NPDC051208]|uniref:hypothetical protein n=1 Tax=Lentzea sp. NPDC051208 TaxID=3154642 RepID=UPI00342C4599
MPPPLASEQGLLAYIEPMKACADDDELVEDPRFAYEFKLDGLRAQHRNGLSNRLEDHAQRVWPTPTEVLRIAEQATTLDGEAASLLTITAAWSGCRCLGRAEPSRVGTLVQCSDVWVDDDDTAGEVDVVSSTVWTRTAASTRARTGTASRPCPLLLPRPARASSWPTARNHPIPAEAPPDHPLRDLAIVRSLVTCPAEQGLQIAMERELKNLLHSSDTAQDLLGAAA